MKSILNQMIKKGYIPIARTGLFTDSGGREHFFTKEKLSNIARNYDRNSADFREAPCVVGHPKTDSPAFGWIDHLEANGDFLFAKPREIVAEFAEAVKKGLYKYVSPSIRKNDTLKHVGFLGGQPPAIPGLGPVSEVFANFAEDEECTTVEFAFSEFEDRRILSTIAGLFRNIRETLIEKFGQESADRAIPGYAIEGLSVGSQEGSFAEQEIEEKKEEVPMPELKTTENENGDEEKKPTADPDIKSNDERIKAAEERAKAAEDAVKEMKRQQQEENAGNFVEEAVNTGKIHKDDALKFKQLLLAVGDLGTYNFSEGGQETEFDPAGFLKKYVDGVPSKLPLEKIKLGATVGDDGITDFDFAEVDDADLELHRKTVAIQKENAGMDYETALAEARRK